MNDTPGTIRTLKINSEPLAMKTVWVRRALPGSKDDHLRDVTMRLDAFEHEEGHVSQNSAAFPRLRTIEYFILVLNCINAHGLRNTSRKLAVESLYDCDFSRQALR